MIFLPHSQHLLKEHAKTDLGAPCRGNHPEGGRMVRRSGRRERRSGKRVRRCVERAGERVTPG